MLPNTENGGGISNKITDEKTRERLAEMIKKLNIDKGMSIILRTSSQQATSNAIKKDYQELRKSWDDIRQKTNNSQAPTLLHKEADLVHRIIRDHYSDTIEEIIVNDEKIFEDVKKHARELDSSLAKKVRHYQNDPRDMLQEFQVENDLRKLHGRIVPLSSGAYLVIDMTEAMIVIDVNSGSNTRNRNIDEMALTINLEAAEEIARQLRLRELSGLIAIDFIDMNNSKDNVKVETKMRECFVNDYARLKIGHISPFGILEMTRQRMATSFTEKFSDLCKYCGGTGRIYSQQKTMQNIIRALRQTLESATTKTYRISLSPSLAELCLNDPTGEMGALREKYAVTIHIDVDVQLAPSDYRIDDGKNPIIYTTSHPTEQKNHSDKQIAKKQKPEPYHKRRFFPWKKR